MQDWVYPVAYCENDRHAQAVLLSRMQAVQLPVAPIWDDAQTLAYGIIPYDIDIIYGGFPCQDISVAGNGSGLAGKRSGLFYEVGRLCREFKPTFVFLENVPAIRTRGAETVCKEFSIQGYDSRWDVVSAAEVGAPHLRKRWFFLAAHAERLDLWIESRRSRGKAGEGSAIVSNDGQEKPLANATSERGASRRPRSETRRRQPHPFEQGWWDVEPGIRRVANGVPQRVDRLRGLGNAVVPIQAREAFKRLMGL